MIGLSSSSLLGGQVLLKTRNLLNLTWSPKILRHFSSATLLRQGRRESVQERQLPSLIYIQNPITWLINKMDFKMLKGAWDPDFDEDEFKRGAKQAVAIICTLISKNLWDNLRGLVTRQALTRLRRDVEVEWSDQQRRNIDLKAEDIKLTLPRKVHFLRIGEKRFVDVDVMCVGLKFKDLPPSVHTDFVLVEMVVRFHRNYSPDQLPNWTVTLFKVTRFNVKEGK